MVSQRNGFTIVELLIVIVVIAILASITVVAFSGMRNRAEDTRRAADIASIKKALLAYDTFNSGVPTTSAYLATAELRSGWDASVNGGWLSFLKPAVATIPVDPVNKLSATNNPPSSGNSVYYYYCYDPNSGPLASTGLPNVSLGYTKSDGSQPRDNFTVTACLRQVPPAN